VLTQIKNSHAALRFLPLFVYMVIMMGQGRLGPASLYWVYALKMVAGACMLAWVWAQIRELKWSFNVASIGVGILVFLIWVGLDGYYPTLSQLFSRGAPAAPPDPVWNPLPFFAGSPAWGWFFVGVRILGTMLVVPAIEEIFYRSLMYRAIASPDYERFPLSQFSAKAFLITSLIFGLMHPNQWIAGVFCGLAYQGLVLRCGHLGEAVSAHAITNLLLGIWVVWKGAWQFW
jgi:uncharacterized protein